MSDPLTAIAAVTALLLLLAGVAKLRQPAATSSALRLARLPDSDGLVRTLGAGEVLLGLAVLTVGGPLVLGALATAYAAFAVFAERQRRAGSSCGCFGVEEAPLTSMHVVVDALAALVAAASALTGGAPIASRLPGASVTTAAGVLALVVASLAVRHLLTSLPALTELTERVLAPDDGVLEVADA